MRILIRKTVSELVDCIIGTQSRSVDDSRRFSFSLTYEEDWESLRQSIEHLRPKLKGNADQLLDMMAQARAHFDAGRAEGAGEDSREGDPGFEQLKLGSRLMQDMEGLVRGYPPLCYPEELYRWPRPAVH
jgi:hypothetical protein